MKKVTLLFMALLTTLFVSAQTEHFIDWSTGVGAAGSITIEVGDTVTWTWADALPHSVTSDAGATETFDSGIITGLGTTFSYTFNLPGTNPYGCDVHSGMTGVITVEQVAGVEDNFALSVNHFPNPVVEKLSVTSEYSFTAYEIYDVLGKKVAAQGLEGTNVSIDMSQLKSGVYFVTVASNDLQKTFKVVKK
ncbi:MAG: T9SS type A sorting domain-containing protein [Flavobacteriaceae bacterium]